MSNSDLDAAKATPKSKGKAKAGTIVRRMRDLVPFRESNGSIELGSGTAGTVYLFRHAKTNEPVALKVIALPPGGVDGNRKSAIEKLQNEMKIIQRLGCMEWFPSSTDAARWQGPKLDKDAWMNVMLDIADGLTVMHKKGFLCNDLKEDNVLLVKSGGEWRAKIIDFGCHAKRDYKYSQAYNYIAPECALKGKGFSVSSDVYSLGRLAAFVGQEMPGLKELGDYGFNIYSSPRGKRPSLQEFSKEINYLRSRTNESDSDEDLMKLEVIKEHTRFQIWALAGQRGT
ncbi:serine/threonine-protein kinase BCK1/SLK1/SSP31-like [Strongylocentrotus purpuratus]|uniref:Protein kinase domain-containing protein n=1 Tax=Strongylocentrotus purpuratus TaxID=7668 RepID=A0A7M7PKM9_STRPU|nr:serine/threonine-protein kinase BCK1/SLK1/SSP31-like [Strongylocentrotus purpuratus]